MSASIIDRGYHGPKPSFRQTIEKMMRRSGLQMAAFDTAPSPFGYLRDDASYDYHYEPRLGLQDIADGYLYLRSWKEYTQCDWLEGYVSAKMFVAKKPFYQAFGIQAGKHLKNADAVNRLFEEQ